MQIRLLITLFLSFATLLACNPKSAEKPQQTEDERKLENLNHPPPEMLANDWKSKTADLLTDDEFNKLFGSDAKKTLNKLPRENYCMWEWMKTDWVVRDNSNDKSDKYTSPKNNVIIRLIDFGDKNIAAATFKQKIDLRTEVWNDQISGIGEGALWANDNRRLIVLVGQYIANLEVFVEDDAVANLPKAKELAAIVIPKLKK